MQTLAATFIRDEANTSPLITVTGVEMSSDFHTVTVLVSVFPKEQEEQALNFLKRKAGAFRGFVKTQAHLKDIPFFEFAIDYGEANRQLLDEIAFTQSKKLEKDTTAVE